jgi:Kef-type K+ transport system membrane component KefB
MALIRSCWQVSRPCLSSLLSGELFERFRQPAVLGELIGGIFIGNLTLLGITMTEPLKTNIVISALAELGVIILLFEVGLESDLGKMLEVGSPFDGRDRSDREG